MDRLTRFCLPHAGFSHAPLATARLEAVMEHRHPGEARRAPCAFIERRGTVAVDDWPSSLPLPVPLAQTSPLAEVGVPARPRRLPNVLIDQLSQRLAFERNSVKLYDALLLKCPLTGPGLPQANKEQLQRFRDQEAQHVTLLSDVLNSFGATLAPTPGAELIDVEAQGLVRAMNDPRIAWVQALHVMLDAELIDNTGWELLIELICALGHRDLVDGFVLAARQEAEHLATMRRLVRLLTLEEAGIEQAVLLPEPL